MMNKVIFIITLFAFKLCYGATPTALNDLQRVLKAEEEVRIKLNSKLLDSLKQTTALSLNSKNKTFEEELNNKISTIVEDRNNIFENHLRIDFLNLLINKLEGAGTTGDIKKTIENILIDISHKQLISGAENNNDSDLWLFCTYLAIAIRDIMEPNENLADFIKKYIVFSSIREPRSPSDFLKERDYINP